LKILAIDSSAKSASTALTDGKHLISECFVNTTLTHSRTLMPMIDNMLKQSDTDFSEVDAFCVSAGPGSFTGIRIGVAAIKGLALAQNKPCAGISTLEAMAYNFTDENCVVCAVMDARCNQVYNALFRIENGVVSRICEDRALPINELLKELEKYDEAVYFAGDGAEICFNSYESRPQNIKLSSENRRYQRAYGVALAASEHNELFQNSALLAPVYLRLPQAERELKIRKGEKL